MLAGSLDVLARSSPDSRLGIDLFGDDRLRMVSHTPAGALEGAIFSGAVVAAMMLARRDGSVG